MVARAVTTTGVAGALYRGPRTRGPRITTFYCKLFTLKAKVNFSFFRLESAHTNRFVYHFRYYVRFFVVAFLGPLFSKLMFVFVLAPFALMRLMC